MRRGLMNRSDWEWGMEILNKFKELLRIRRARFGVGAAIFTLTACASTGGPFGLSDEQGLALGEQEHPKIVAAFGGELDDPAVRAYVEGITDKLMAGSAEPNFPIKMTVLDSPIINAMALPGHLYVTRGLLALGNSEAELAGVIGHEIGHVLERHTAQRVSRGNLAGLGAAVVGILTGDAQTAQLAGQVGQLYLLRFSRQQEYEADLVGVRLLANAGYDPAAEADFLNSLGRWSALQAQIAGQSSAPPEFLSTHPNTAERVERAAAEAQVLAQGGLTAERSREQYLNRIDGILYGDDPVKQGFIRGNEFIHPELGLAFSVPNGFKLQNSSTAVVATANNAQMQFTAANSANAPASIVQNELSQALGVQLANIRRFQVDGREGAVGSARTQLQNGTVVDVQGFVVKWQGSTNYMFLWVTAANQTASLQRAIEQSVGTLRDINPSSVSVPPTRQVDVVTAQPGDTVSGLAQLMAFDSYKEEHFRVLNALEANEGLIAGQRIKLVR